MCEEILARNPHVRGNSGAKSSCTRNLAGKILAHEDVSGLRAAIAARNRMIGRFPVRFDAQCTIIRHATSSVWKMKRCILVQEEFIEKDPHGWGIARWDAEWPGSMPAWLHPGGRLSRIFDERNELVHHVIQKCNGFVVDEASVFWVKFVPGEVDEHFIAAGRQHPSLHAGR